jgi:proteasome accessory factor C
VVNTNETAAERLKRILVLVPWVMARRGATVDEVCERFGLTRDELIADLDLIFLCGLPPFGPGDLMEAYIEGDEVVIGMADYLARPPRLTRGEATALLVMGRAVARMPGLEEASALRSALAKLERAMPADGARDSTRDRALDLAERIEVEIATPGAELVGALRAAITQRTTMRISYYSAGRGEMSERDVDPWVVFAANGAWYVSGFDRLSNEERTFRLDRIRECAPSGATFDPPAGLDAARRSDGPVFTPSPRDIVAVVELGQGAGWLKDVIPFERETKGPKGATRVEVRTTHTAWLARLLLAAGPAARPISPPELVEEVRATARRALALYERPA